MPYTTVTDFKVGDLSSSAALAAALNYYSVMAGGSVNDTLAGHLSSNSLAHGLYVPNGADSHFRFESAVTPIEVVGAYATRALLYADLVPVADTLVNCFDPDVTKRGIFKKIGGTGTGSWNRESPTVADKYWPDYNHPQRLLELILCSQVKTNAPLGFMGAQQGWAGPQAGAINDWRNVRLTLYLACENLRLGPWAKIGMHFQGNVAALAAKISAMYPESPNPKYVLPNFMQVRQLISDQLGFGNNSWGKPNDVPISSCGRTNVVIDFTTDDTDYECFGDVGRDPTGRLINYASSPVSKVLENLQGNSYMLAHHDVPVDGNLWWSKSSAEMISDFDRTRGAILFYGYKIEAYSE